MGIDGSGVVVLGHSSQYDVFSRPYLPDIFEIRTTSIGVPAAGVGAVGKAML